MNNQNITHQRKEEGWCNTVIQVIVVIFAIAALAHITMKIRIPDIMTSTKTLIAQFSQMKIKDICIQMAKNYFIYILLSIILVICIFYVTRNILQSRMVLSGFISHHYFQKFLKPTILFLLLFFVVNVFITNISRKQYTKFYDDFKEGRVGTQFMGFKQYHFLNHADQTKRILTQLNEQAKNIEQKALIEGVRDIVKKQDKNVSAFRSYVANYNLIFKLFNIFYQFLGFIGIFSIVIILSIYMCFFRNTQAQRQYGSIELQQHDEESQQSLVNCPQETVKHKCASTFYIILVLIIFSALIITSFVIGDIFLQLKIGHPYNNNIQQKQVCSFHKHVGGFYINIDYQNQLVLAQQFNQVEKMFYQDSQKGIQLVDKLQSYLKIYVNLCQILQPYYLIHKEHQCKLSQLFYRHFYAFIYIFWRYYRMMKESKIAETQQG